MFKRARSIRYSGGSSPGEASTRTPSSVKSRPRCFKRDPLVNSFECSLQVLLQRLKELHDKGKQVIDEVLGARVGSMLRIGILCTAPAKQGHGYASALVRSVIALVRGILGSMRSIRASALSLFLRRTRESTLYGSSPATAPTKGSTTPLDSRLSASSCWVTITRCGLNLLSRSRWYVALQPSAWVLN